jgi:hypothetical protein
MRLLNGIDKYIDTFWLILMKIIISLIVYIEVDIVLNINTFTI